LFHTDSAGPICTHYRISQSELPPTVSHFPLAQPFLAVNETNGFDAIPFPDIQPGFR
jgi:hypothetical protein